jgi:hypothetical protein
VQLAPAAPRMAVAEGIENALAVMIGWEMPCWAALSANGIAQLVLPPVEGGLGPGPRASRAGSRNPCGRNRSDPQGARSGHRRNAQNPNYQPYFSCSADSAAARKDSGSNNQFYPTTFRGNCEEINRDSVFEPIKTSGFYNTFEWPLASIVDDQPESSKATEFVLQLPPNPGIWTLIYSVLFDAGCLFALPASEAAMQRRGDGLCPAGHEQSSCAVLYRLAPPCGDTQVLYILIQRLVAEYAPRFGVGVVLPLAMTISPRCRCTPALATIELRIGRRLKRYACICRTQGRRAAFAAVGQRCRGRYGLI